MRQHGGKQEVAPGSQIKFSIIYENATDRNFQITSKFSIEHENLQIEKLLKFSNSTTFSIKTFQI
jgi:hypothetical protein